MGIRSTASITVGQYAELVGAVVRQLPHDIDPTDAQRWIEDQGALQQALRGALMPDSKLAGNVYTVVVDYGKSVEEMVGLGRYDWSDNDITSEHFPTKRVGKTEIAVELVHFNRHIGTDEALTELDRMGYRPAEIYELLAFGEKYPEIQREFPIIALGSVWQHSNGRRLVPYLRGGGAGRSLHLGWLEVDWDDVCRFAAVRK